MELKGTYLYLIELIRAESRRRGSASFELDTNSLPEKDGIRNEAPAMLDIITERYTGIVLFFAVRLKDHHDPKFATHFRVSLPDDKHLELLRQAISKDFGGSGDSASGTEISKKFTSNELAFEQANNDRIFFRYQAGKSKEYSKKLQWVQTLAYLIRKKNEGGGGVKFQDVWDNLLEIEKITPNLLTRKPKASDDKSVIRKSVIRHVDTINKNLKSDFTLGKSKVCTVGDSGDEILVLM